jgi:hypothetical protein
VEPVALAEQAEDFGREPHGSPLSPAPVTTRTTAVTSPRSAKQ